MTFSWGQLFRDNRYTGADRQTDANQLTTALTTRLISEDDGRERLAASIGQIRYFDDSRVTLPGRDPGRAGQVGLDRRRQRRAERPLGHQRGLPVGPEAPRRGPGQPARALPVRRRRHRQLRLPLPPQRRLPSGIDPPASEDLLEQADFSFLYPINRELERGRPLLLLAAGQEGTRDHRRRAMGKLLPGRARGRPPLPAQPHRRPQQFAAGRVRAQGPGLGRAEHGARFAPCYPRLRSRRPLSRAAVLGAAHQQSRRRPTRPPTRPYEESISR